MNYNGLNALIDLVNNNDFYVLGVPSNVFGLQVIFLIPHFFIHS